MTRFLVQDMIAFLSMFPYKNVISSDLRPEVIVLGPLNPDYNKLKITFGAYIQVYIGTTNSPKQKMVGEITLRPANEKRVYFLNGPSHRETAPQIHMDITTW